jgi:hypothetical protein
MYGYKAGFKGNQENMARYREENDKVMFDAISSKLEALGSAHGIDFEFEFFREGLSFRHRTPPGTYYPHYEASMKVGLAQEFLLIVSFASGAHHPHQSSAGSMLSRMIRLMAKRTQGCLCG